MIVGSISYIIGVALSMDNLNGASSPKILYLMKIFVITYRNLNYYSEVIIVYGP